jgi:hypothetical protein
MPSALVSRWSELVTQLTKIAKRDAEKPTTTESAASDEIRTLTRGHLSAMQLIRVCNFSSI